MNKHFSSQEQFDLDHFYPRLMTCFNSIDDPLLFQAQNVSWYAMAQYYANNGSNVDYKGRDDNWAAKSSGYEEAEAGLGALIGEGTSGEMYL